MTFNALSPEGTKSSSPSLIQGDHPIHKTQATPGGIPNHITARLSDLDMRMVKSVPQGGNWKDIPTDIPSKRLDQIRESFKRGEGSRSTYYGRLRREYPAYTISTYFCRPGNGCHIHYEQDRVLSQREAARIQSFPDSFEFLGPQGAINTQIGNAVPPLLAFQIAQSLGQPGVFIDLFSGAGGMGLGFKWAGWVPILANDIHPAYLSTYARNVHDEVVAGSISDEDIMAQLVVGAKRARADGRPFWVLGGPPCQGFSTAGNLRSMKDPRNHLVWDYVRFLEQAKPDGFVFENVTGLQNMDGGAVFASVRLAFSKVMSSITPTVMSADDYAVPQRRKRVILVGSNRSGFIWAPPAAVTSLDTAPSLVPSLPAVVSVEEALSDLPPLKAGGDGRQLPYASEPLTAYQALMRGLISASEFLNRIQSGRRDWRGVSS
jgi:DNA (cytosine-5)-methyltransferase 1